MNKAHSLLFALMIMTVSLAGCTSFEGESSDSIINLGGMDSYLEDFKVEPASFNFTSNGNESLVYVTMNHGSDMNWEHVILHLSLDSSNFTACSTPIEESDSRCHVTDDGDGNWTLGETITIREGDIISCDGQSHCDVQLKIFESATNVSPIPEIIIESLNRSGIESDIADENGQINISTLRGNVIIIDMMAHDCSNCHAVQQHLEANMDVWQQTAEANGKQLNLIAYGAWYGEDIPYLNTSGGGYTVPLYPTGLGNTTAAMMSNNTTADPARLFTTGGTGQIPVVMVIDEEGYIIARQATGTPTDRWSGFDSMVDKAISSNADTSSYRIAWEESMIIQVYESTILTLQSQIE